jgi:hypothetical protein
VLLGVVAGVGLVCGCGRATFRVLRELGTVYSLLDLGLFVFGAV